MSLQLLKSHDDEGPLKQYIWVIEGGRGGGGGDCFSPWSKVVLLPVQQTGV